MSAAEWKVDRDRWPVGPWDGEPDRVEWRSHGMPCLAVRNRMGAWCGYVAVGAGHPDHGRDYSDVDADVHGGLTYSDRCAGPICHVPKAGEEDAVWWLGFDCAHAGDLVPALVATIGRGMFGADRYRSLAYVRAEVERLAEQLAERAGGVA